MSKKAADLFKVLSVESRVRILELLRTHGQLGAKKIAEELGITVAAVSQHLKVLQQAHLIESERQGYHIPYSVNEDSLMHCRVMMNKVCRCECHTPHHHHHHNHHGHHHDHHHHSGNCQCTDSQSLPQNITLEDLLEYKKDLELELEKIQVLIDKLKK